MFFCISSWWLHKSWGKIHAFDVLPQCTVKKNTFKIITFVKKGIAMRICETNIAPTITDEEINTTFIVTNAMRSFIAKIKEFHSSVKIEIDIENKSITFTVESAASALKYTFEHVEFDDEKYIEPTTEDIPAKVPWADWKSLCFMAPSTGNLTIQCTARKRACLIRHDGGRWACAIQLQEKITQNIHFVCDSEAVRRLTMLFNTDSSFINIVFLKCGVMKWTDNRGLYGFIAPVL